MPLLVTEHKYPMEITDLKFTFDDNWHLTQAYLEWDNRFFYLRRKTDNLEITEWETKKPFKGKELGYWEMDYPIGEMSADEIQKVFWHLVASRDPKRLERHHEQIKEWYRSRKV